ncbi:coagulation factor XIII A chain-like [Hippoglossus hippoglossus]|uniref:coagulation factor XIII A chain-like n=1 Tax=Hippoglossus hippoglossus TaxID=8267 RepID=UPI00148DFF99|nr:coagulation factor XIII A chain-like [Hippoglossus hippoglossus]
MSRETSESTTYRGRYNNPVPKSNLTIEDDNFPEFEPFGGVGSSEATPRTSSEPSLSVQKVDMCQAVNEPNHFTSAYDTDNLLVRRGWEFVIRITFSRVRTEEDDFQLEFLIGSNPAVTKNSKVIVPFGSRVGSTWLGQIRETQGESLLVGITPTPDAIMGKYRIYVATKVNGGLQRTSRDISTDMYLLFNAWCPEDIVYVPGENERREYVLNDHGVIFQGNVGSVSHRNWMYGQFEKGILDACISILDASLMPITDRGNVIKVIRKGSAMVNSQDDQGVLVGNWSEDFSMGISPTSWTGSIKILQQYAETGVPVCFAQCWVFAGVFNTFLRCLGIPARVITNFCSAHDNTGNLIIDLIFNPDGTPDQGSTTDSIWNYHCWNEVYMVRNDLPSSLGGWQVVDATPQETSDGHFRCGPASVTAIKNGLLCHPFDCGFVFAEVNSDVIFKKRDEFGALVPYRIEKNHVGQALYTKAVGSYATSDITHTYKYPQDTAEDNLTMSRAEEYGCARDHSDLSESELSVIISVDQAMVGQDLKLVMDFHNLGEVPRNINGHLSGSVVFYTGIQASQFKDESFGVLVPAKQTVSVPMHIAHQDYMPYRGHQLSLHFVVTGQADDQSVSAIKVVDLLTPKITLSVSGQPQVGQQMFVTVSFTNALNFSLVQPNLIMDGPGLTGIRSRLFNAIEPDASVSWTEMFVPRFSGQRRIFALLDCLSLNQVWGLADIVIAD